MRRTRQYIELRLARAPQLKLYARCVEKPVYSNCTYTINKKYKRNILRFLCDDKFECCGIVHDHTSVRKQLEEAYGKSILE